MITEVGRFFRKLRIDNDEILLEMADRLGVSASFLSAVENGKKRMPSSWQKIICDEYRLSEEKREEFDNVIANTEENFDINLKMLNIESKNLAISFARKLPEMDSEQIKKIKNILKKGDK